MGELTITISVTTVMLTNCQPCCVVETNACCAKVALTCMVGMSVTIKCLFDRSRYFLFSVAGNVCGWFLPVFLTLLPPTATTTVDVCCRLVVLTKEK